MKKYLFGLILLAALVLPLAQASAQTATTKYLSISSPSKDSPQIFKQMSNVVVRWSVLKSDLVGKVNRYDVWVASTTNSDPALNIKLANGKSFFSSFRWRAGSLSGGSQMPVGDYRLYVCVYYNTNPAPHRESDQCDSVPIKIVAGDVSTISGIKVNDVEPSATTNATSTKGENLTLDWSDSSYNSSKVYRAYLIKLNAAGERLGRNLIAWTNVGERSLSWTPRAVLGAGNTAMHLDVYPAARYKVEICPRGIGDCAQSGIFDLVDRVTEITITYPLGGETLERGLAYTASWVDTVAARTNYHLYLASSSQPTYKLDLGPVIGRSNRYTIPSYLATSSGSSNQPLKYYLWVVDANDSSKYDVSRPFSLRTNGDSSAVVGLTSSLAGDSVRIGDSIVYRWSDALFGSYNWYDVYASSSTEILRLGWTGYGRKEFRWTAGRLSSSNNRIMDPGSYTILVCPRGYNPWTGLVACGQMTQVLTAGAASTISITSPVSSASFPVGQDVVISWTDSNNGESYNIFAVKNGVQSLLGRNSYGLREYIWSPSTAAGSYYVKVCPSDSAKCASSGTFNFSQGGTNTNTTPNTGFDSGRNTISSSVCGSNNIPTTMVAGETKRVFVDVGNTSNVSWNYANNFKLGELNIGKYRAVGGRPDSTVWGVNRAYRVCTSGFCETGTANQANLASGNTVSGTTNWYRFVFDLKAPTVAGTYTLDSATLPAPRFMMLKENVDWFGSVCGPSSVTVTAAANTTATTPDIIFSNNFPSAVGRNGLTISWTDNTYTGNYSVFKVISGDQTLLSSTVSGRTYTFTPDSNIIGSPIYRLKVCRNDDARCRQTPAFNITP